MQRYMYMLLFLYNVHEEKYCNGVARQSNDPWTAAVSSLSAGNTYNLSGTLPGIYIHKVSQDACGFVTSEIK